MSAYIHSELKFNDDVSKIYKKACSKLIAFQQLTNILILQQRKSFMKSFIDSLRIVYEDYTSSFDNLLKKDKNTTFHQKNIEKLAISIKLKIILLLK